MAVAANWNYSPSLRQMAAAKLLVILIASSRHLGSIMTIVKVYKEHNRNQAIFFIISPFSDEVELVSVMSLYHQ